MDQTRHLKTEPLPFAHRAIPIKAIDGSVVRCGVSEVLAALIESRKRLTVPQVAVCRRFFNREHLANSAIVRDHG